MELKPGLMVTPSVRLVRLLGEGGMGSVWVADHLTLKTQVAVKFLLADLVRRNPEMLARFEREASAAAQIKSPHVVATFDSGVMEDGTPFIVMELLEGEDLGMRMERADPLSVSATGQLLTQVAKALRKAHKLGIVHRDIKPDNLFLVDSGHTESDDDPVVEDLFVKVLDFGIAKHADSSSMTQTGAMFGTPGFMSPEQLASTKNVDHQADLWALAVVAYWSLTGQPPFDGETLATISMAVCRGEFTPPSQLGQGLAPTLDAWFAQAFDLNAQNRFKSADQMAATFRQVSMGGCALNHPVAMGDEPSRPPGGTPGAADGPPSWETAAAPNGSHGVGAGSTGPTIGALATMESSAPAQSGHLGNTSLGPASSTLEPAGVPSRSWRLPVMLGLPVLVVAAGATSVIMMTQGQTGPAGASSDSPTEPSTPPTLTTTEVAPSTSTKLPETTTAGTSGSADTTSAPQPSGRPPAPTKPTVQPVQPSTPKTNCDPPYWIDGDGHRHYKPECI